MPPKKRKAAAAREVHIDADALEAINDKLKTIDAAGRIECIGTTTDAHIIHSAPAC